jgi:hypothetical protein
MGINDKSFRLRGLRDRLHLTGRHEPTFNQAVDIILEVLGLVHSNRNLSWCRMETAKLRHKNPTPSVEQLQRFAFLEDRLLKKAELIKNRHERKKARAADPKKRGPKPKLTPVVTPGSSPIALWEEMLLKQQREKNRGTER